VSGDERANTDMADESPIIEVRGVSFSYPPIRVLENVDLSVEPRDFVGLIGPNGGGKTTLVKLILGLLRPDQGEVRLFGQPPVVGRRWAGYVPQHAGLDREFPIHVRDVVLMGRLRELPRGPWISRYSAEDHEAADEAMELMDVRDLGRRTIGELSGGQLQRVLIARALAGRPRLLVLDEPTANVDSHFQQEVHETLRRLNERLTIILISHDLGFVSSYVNRIACLNRTLVCHPTDQVSDDMMHDLYQGDVHRVRHEQHL
jgi:zinc transport system ATP-binding protein